MSTEKVDMLSAALDYCRHKFSVIQVHTIRENGLCSCGDAECTKPAKHPTKPWKNKTLKRPSEDQIRKEWEQNPNRNVAVITGKTSGLSVLDIDGEVGMRSLEAIGLSFDKLPVTPTVETGGGGYHLYYRYSELAKTKAGNLPGVDTRSENGYCVAVPSRHASGKRYEWMPGRSLDDVPIAEFDFSLLSKSKPKATEVIEETWYEELSKGVPEGKRHDAATRLIGRYVQKGMTRDEIVSLMMDWNQKNSPPMPEEEILTIIDSIMAKEQAQESEGRYVIRDGSIFKVKIEKGGVLVYQQLCNFTAEVAEEIEKDDNITVERFLIVKGRIANGRELPPIQVPAVLFSNLGWVLANWGIDVVINAGTAIKDCVREAIQRFSTNIIKRTIFTHTGWRLIDDTWVFLSAGTKNYDVELPKQLEKYSLPEQCKDPVAAVRASLRFLETAPPDITIPILSAAYAAPLAEVIPLTFLLFLYGITGSLKTTLACLGISHYGGFDRASAPVTFHSTANSIERLTCQAKDVLFLVDDFYPQASESEARQQELIAQRLIRGQSAHTGRARMKSDASLRPSYYARGLVVATGEILPTGQSTNARMLTVDISRENINLENVSSSQAEAEKYPEAMKSYLDWLAPQMTALKKELPEKVRALREEFSNESSHLNVAEMVSQLYMGWLLFLDHAMEIGAITAETKETWVQTGFSSMVTLAQKQQTRITEERPTNKFLGIIKDLLIQGRVYFEDANSGEPPEDWGNWGWRPDPENGTFACKIAPGADRLGWVDEKEGYVYMLSESGYRVAVRFAREQGEPITMSRRTLYMQLRKDKKLIPLDGKDTYTKKIRGLTPRIVRLVINALK